MFSAPSSILLRVADVHANATTEYNYITYILFLCCRMSLNPSYLHCLRLLCFGYLAAIPFNDHKYVRPVKRFRCRSPMTGDCTLDLNLDFFHFRVFGFLFVSFVAVGYVRV